MITALLMLKLIIYVCAGIGLGVVAGKTIEGIMDFNKKRKGARRANKRLYRH